jgi:hypothetical protein
MPEAAAHVEDHPETRQHDIRTTGKGRDVKPEAITHPVECPAHRHLRTGIAGANARHDP